MCVTRPRRFGKSLALSMLNAYYSKGCDSRDLFKDLAISKDPSFDEHLNKHNVFCIDMNGLYSNLNDPKDFVAALKGEILRMLNGEAIEVDSGKFENDLTNVGSRDAALTVLIHLGYLAYLPPEDGGRTGKCRIPNEEIRRQFEAALEALDWKDAYDPIGNSKKLCEETFKGNTDFIDKTLDRNHKELASFISKNDEKVLTLIVATSYYRARDSYRVKQEDTCIRGRSDVSFFPIDPGHIPFVVELKIGHSPEETIAQIKEWHYWEDWPDYKGKVLLVGVAYDPKTSKHRSKVEWIDVK